MFQVIIVLLKRWKIILRLVVDLEQPAAPIRVLFALHGIQCALGQGGPLDWCTANVTREFLLARHFPINAIVATGKSQYGGNRWANQKQRQHDGRRSDPTNIGRSSETTTHN
jgi:hypothetical protein